MAASISIAPAGSLPQVAVPTRRARLHVPVQPAVWSSVKRIEERDEHSERDHCSGLSEGLARLGFHSQKTRKKHCLNQKNPSSYTHGKSGFAQCWRRSEEDSAGLEASERPTRSNAPECRFGAGRCALRGECRRGGDMICPRCNLRPRARRRNWSAVRCYERSTGEVLEMDAYHEYCTPCRAELPGHDDAPTLAVVEDAEADSIRWLIERNRSKETTARKPHFCYRCGGEIAVGQRYRRVRGGAARVDVALHEKCLGEEGGKRAEESTAASASPGASCLD